MTGRVAVVQLEHVAESLARAGYAVVANPDQTAEVQLERTPDGNILLTTGSGTHRIVLPADVHPDTLASVVQLALDASDSGARQLLEASGEAFALVDAGYRLLYVNQKAESLAHRKREQVLGRLLWEAFPNLRNTPFYALHERVMRSRQSESVQSFYDRTQRWYEVKSVPTAEGGLAIYFRDITEERAAHEKLAASRLELQAVFQHMAGAAAIFDAAGRLLGANPAFYALHGATEQNAPPDYSAAVAMFDVTTPEGRMLPAEERPVGRALRGETVQKVLLRGARKDGRAQWVGIYSAAPIRSPAGELHRVILSIHDVTELSRAREELARSQERLTLAQQAGRIGVFDWDLATGRIYASPEMEGLFGLEPGAFAGTVEAWRELLSAQDAQAALATVHDAIARRAAAVQYDYCIIVPSGRRRRLHSESQIVYDASGRAVRIVGVKLDVTETYEARLELERSLTRLALAQKAAHAGVWSWDLRTNSVDWSDEYYEIYGIDRSLPPSFQTGMDAVHPEDREEVRREAYAAVQEKRDFRTEHRVLRPDGVHWVAGFGQALYDDRGEPLSMTGIILDITERKRTEEALRHSNEDLQSFAYAASHDLQEPLRMISSYSQLLARRTEGSLDPDSQDFLNYIREGAERMSELIRDLLEYSRVTHSGALVDTVDAGVALQRALEHLKILIEDTHAEIVCEHLPVVCALETRLVQVFQNLIGNALKYRAPDRLPEIHVFADRAGTDWRFAVRDNGIGFDMRHAERIFGIFKRLHPHSDYQGTGIGLALVKRIVEQFGGRVWAESRPGVGSTFFFTLPGPLQ